MFIFDSDHLSLLQYEDSVECQNLAKRVAAHASASDFFVTIVSFHEQVNGWIQFVGKSSHTSALVRGYTKLEGIIDDFSRAQVLPFSSAAADIYDELRQQRVRVGTMDLRIASIAIANQMTLLTRNTVDFERIPNLSFEDWTTTFKTDTE